MLPTVHMITHQETVQRLRGSQPASQIHTPRDDEDDATKLGVHDLRCHMSSKRGPAGARSSSVVSSRDGRAKDGRASALSENASRGEPRESDHPQDAPLPSVRWDERMKALLGDAVVAKHAAHHLAAGFKKRQSSDQSKLVPDPRMLGSDPRILSYSEFPPADSVAKLDAEGTDPLADSHASDGGADSISGAAGPTADEIFGKKKPPPSRSSLPVIVSAIESPEQAAPVSAAPMACLDKRAEKLADMGDHTAGGGPDGPAVGKGRRMRPTVVRMRPRPRAQAVGVGRRRVLTGRARRRASGCRPSAPSWTSGRCRRWSRPTASAS